MNTIENYHKNRTVLDFNYINTTFRKEEHIALEKTKVEFPNCILRMVNSDLIANNITGFGGSIPANWNGRIVQL